MTVSTSEGHPEARAQALALEDTGALREAIGAWSALNTSVPDAEIEERLVRLRHRAAAQADGAARTPWPPRLADPFPDVEARPPEIGAEALTPEVLGGAIHHHGCLLVRGLVDSRRAAELVETVDRAFAAREELESASSAATTTPWYAPDPAYDAVGPQAIVQRTLNRNLNSMLAVDSPRALFKIIDALEQRGVPATLREYFGEPAVLTAEKTTLRRVRPGPSPAWHQDGSFLGTDVRTVDVWIALSRCGGGTNSSGLQVLPRRLDRILDCGTEGTRTGIEIMSDDVLRAGEGIEPICPTFEPGDALLFDEHFLHRTQPGLEEARYALEIWTFAA
jgi:phytanoyl-CoA dioxygenase PhyH